MEIRLALGSIDALDATFDAHLPLQLAPEKQDGGMRIACEFDPLAAVVIGEPRKATCIELLDEDDARAGFAVCIHRGHVHCIRLVDFGAQRFVEPPRELGNGIVEHIGVVQAGLAVIFADVGHRVASVARH